ncbi:MAG: RNA 2',3'-cyclic phosphodiesterase [candidate division Zixibacteria bacterium]|nr:RNA 2',3'-cyclic phosphodiesterase [candidate division Zixibacteria bacterium]
MRSFIAVELTDELKREIEKLQEPLRRVGADVAWVKPGNVHATLKFLGEVSDDSMKIVFEGTRKALEGVKGFKLSLKDLGCFPNLKRPRVIWIGVEKGKMELGLIQRKIEQEMENLSFPKENREFSPHLTIGRVKSPKNVEKLTELVKSIDFQPEEIVIKEVVLMKSQLHPGGSIYTPLFKINLIT